MRVLLVATLLVALLAAPAAALVLDPPVEGPVLVRFDAPTRYGPGHRGVDLGVAPGTSVRAAAAGRVTFAGPVVGDIWVTVGHGMLRTTVGPLTSTAVARGDHVRRGTVLGTSGYAHGRPAVHWSARQGDTYLDPLLVGRHVATLLPTSPTRRPAPSPRPDHRVR